MRPPFRLGTSGYSFDDWRGAFYPPGTSGSGMLPFYAREFDVVEINSTHYRIMAPSSSAGMVARTPEGFGFAVKLHSGMTHAMDAGDAQWRAFSEMLEPFREAGRLECLLAQFPFAFRCSESSLARVGEIVGRCAPVPLAVEFRHDSWYADGLAGIEAAASSGAAPVSVDLPALPGLPPRVPVGGSPFGYVRFHGRNARDWWGGGTLRYDYGYSEEELRSWLPGLSDLSGRAGKVFIFFNNCHGAQAVDSARMMRGLLEGGA